jgi:hypothetical protein
LSSQSIDDCHARPGKKHSQTIRTWTSTAIRNQANLSRPDSHASVTTAAATGPPVQVRFLEPGTAEGEQRHGG